MNEAESVVAEIPSIIPLAEPAKDKEIQKDEDESAVFKITEEDQKVAQSLLETMKTLINMKRTLGTTPADNFPFKSPKARSEAKDLIQLHVQKEIQLIRFLLEILRAKTKILKNEAYTEEDFVDIHTLGPWIAHVSKLHAQNVEGIFDHATQIVRNHEKREDVLQKLFEKNLKCSIHNQPAVGRSLDGKSIICASCKTQQQPE